MANVLGNKSIHMGSVNDKVFLRRVWPCGCVDCIAPLYSDHGQHQKIESDAWNLFFDREYCESHAAEDVLDNPPLPMIVMLYRESPNVQTLDIFPREVDSSSVAE